MSTSHLPIVGRFTADIRTVFNSVRTKLNRSTDHRLNIRICLEMHRWAFVWLVRVVAATWLISDASVPKSLLFIDHAIYDYYFMNLRPTIIRASYNINVCKMAGKYSYDVWPPVDYCRMVDNDFPMFVQFPAGNR